MCPGNQSDEEAFATVEGIQTPEELEDAESGWHLYMIQVPEERRERMFEQLREAGIGVNVHYIPVYRHPYYQSCGYAGCFCPNAEGFYERALTLPLYPDLTEEQQDYVIEKVTEYIK